MNSAGLADRRERGSRNLTIEATHGDMASGRATIPDQACPSNYVDDPNWTAYFDPTFSVNTTSLGAHVPQPTSLGHAFPTINPEDVDTPMGTYRPNPSSTLPYHFSLLSPHLSPSLPLSFHEAGIPTAADSRLLIAGTPSGLQPEPITVSPITTVHTDLGEDATLPGPRLGISAANLGPSRTKPRGAHGGENPGGFVGNQPVDAGATEVDGGQLKKKYKSTYKGTRPEVVKPNAAPPTSGRAQQRRNSKHPPLGFINFDNGKVEESFVPLTPSSTPQSSISMSKLSSASDAIDMATELWPQYDIDGQQSLTGSAARARNRVAATKCRAKSKAASQQLEDDAREAEVQNRMLVDTKDHLKDVVWRLNMQLLEHHGCGDELIDQYIQHSARRKVEKKIQESLARRKEENKMATHDEEENDEEEDDDEDDGEDEGEDAAMAVTYPENY